MVVFFCLFLFVFPLFPLEVSLKKDIFGAAHLENEMFFILSLKHSSKASMDSLRVYLGKEAIEPIFLKRESFDKETDQSQFRIPIALSENSVHLFPSLRVNLDGEEAFLPQFTFQVDQREMGYPDEDFLTLSTKIEAEKPIYVGERLRLVTTFIYRGSIVLIEESLPFLDPPEAFRRIGTFTIEDTEKEGVSIRVITQTVQAALEGVFFFENAFAKGVTLDQRELTAFSEAHEVVVLPPPKGAPSIFSGAIGSFTIKAFLEPRENREVFEPLQLTVLLTSDQPIDTIFPLQLCCQPGFPGNFSHLLPITAIRSDDKTLTYTYSLRPKTFLLEEIPPIYFSYFDRGEKTYRLAATSPIPIHVEMSGPKETLFPAKSSFSLAPFPKEREVEQKERVLWFLLSVVFSLFVIYLFFPYIRARYLKKMEVDTLINFIKDPSVSQRERLRRLKKTLQDKKKPKGHCDQSTLSFLFKLINEAEEGLYSKPKQEVFIQKLMKEAICYLRKA